MVMLHGHDLQTRNHLGSISANFYPDVLATYEPYFAEINPWYPGMLTAPMHRVITDRDLLPREELIKTEFWADYVRPQNDTAAGAGTILFREEDRLLVLTGNYNWARQEDYEGPTVRLLDMLSSHARQAFRIQRTLEGHRLVDKQYREVLDTVSNAVFLIDAMGRLSHPNRQAEALLRSNELVYAGPDKVLHFLDPRADASLARAVSEIASEHVHSLPDAIPLRSNDGVDLCLATVVPFRARVETTGFPSDFHTRNRPIAMLTIIDPARKKHPLRVALSALYQLTPAEIRLAEALNEGLSLTEYSNRRQLSIHTVRNQLKAIFQKTYTQKQAELIGLLHRLSDI